MLRSSFLALMAMAVVCGQTPAPPATTQTPAPAEKPAREPGLYATFNTSMGTIVCILYEKETPITVRNFTSLARGGKAWTDPKTGQKVMRPLYTGLTFHRVMPRFMIQGGDPTGTGMGDGGLKPIPDEIVPTLTFDQPGRLAMANRGPGTGTCQFFITEVPTPHLNGLHTIFGQVVEGQDVVTKIAHVPTGAENKPTTPVKILTVKIVREGPAPAPPVKKAAPAAKKAAAPAPPTKQATPPAKP